MKDFEEFKKQLDFDAIQDYAVKFADKNEDKDNPAWWQTCFDRGAMLEMLRQYHEWLNKQ